MFHKLPQNVYKMQLRPLKKGAVYGLLCYLFYKIALRLVQIAFINLVALQVARSCVLSQTGLMTLAQIPGLPSGSWSQISQAPPWLYQWFERGSLLKPSDGNRILGISYLLAGRPNDSVHWLEPYVNRNPQDVTARLALGHAYYLLGQGVKAAYDYQYVYDVFERGCCDPSYEWGLRHRWSEVLRRIREAELMDAWYSEDANPGRATERLEELASLWPHEMMRLYKLLRIYESEGKLTNAQRLETQLQYGDFEAYGLSEAFPSVIDDLTDRGIWTDQMRQRANMAFNWDMLLKKPSGFQPSDGVCGDPPVMQDVPGNLLPVLSEWGTPVYASQPGLTPEASYRFKVICDGTVNCTAAVLGLWQRQPDAGLQTPRAGFMSPVFVPVPGSSYHFSFDYCTGMGDLMDMPVVAVYIENSSVFPHDFRLGATQGRWRSYTAELMFSAIESQNRLRIWIGSYGNGVTFITSPRLKQADERSPAGVP